MSAKKHLDALFVSAGGKVGQNIPQDVMFRSCGNSRRSIEDYLVLRRLLTMMMQKVQKINKP